jgi:hypothetical protein
MLPRPRCRALFGVLLAALPGLLGPISRVEAAPAAPDSTWSRLPFVPLENPGDFFAASKLTRSYGKDLTPLLGSRRQPAARTDLETLDEYAAAPQPYDSEPDSTDIRLLRERARRSAAEMTPEERAAAAKPEAGVRVGIPSPVAASATLIGGVALLAKILVEFFK